MIYLLVGENYFVQHQELVKIVAGRNYISRDGLDIEVDDLPTLLAGQSLFDDNNLIVLSDISSNKSVWDALARWLDSVGDSTLILIETKADKRTKTYRTLQKVAKIIDCEAWQARDMTKAEKWLQDYASARGLKIDPAIRSNMLKRAMRPSQVDDKQIIDQQLLSVAVDQLLLADEIDEKTIETILPPDLTENVFALLEYAIDGDVQKVQKTVENLKTSQQDGHRVLALLASQAANLVVLVVALKKSVSLSEIAADFKIHPYAASQLQKIAAKITLEKSQKIIAAIADADVRSKSGRGEVWTLVKGALVSIALQK